MLDSWLGLRARGEDEVEIPSLEEMRAILAATASTPPASVTFDGAWVGITIFSGLRPSENRGLAIEDVTVDGPTPGVTVRQRADQWNVIGPVKSASGRRFSDLSSRIEVPDAAIDPVHADGPAVVGAEIDHRNADMLTGVLRQPIVPDDKPFHDAQRHMLQSIVLLEEEVADAHG